MEAPGNGRATNKAYTMKAFRWKSENKAPDKAAGAERVLAPWPPALNQRHQLRLEVGPRLLPVRTQTLPVIKERVVDGE